MDVYIFFWRDSRDPYALYDFMGDRYWTGADEKVEKMLVIKKLLEYR